MSDRNKSSLRIDWFDGTVVEDGRLSAGATFSNFADEDQPEPQTTTKPENKERKPIGFKRLLDISLLKPPSLILEVSHRPGFWMLLDTELKGDFIVLIVKVLANIYKSLELNEKSRIVTQLKTKFEKSSFLDQLNKYLMSLPDVRLSEKKMNTQLWNDVEGFYNNVVSICEGIIDFAVTEDVKMLEKINKILELLVWSSLEVKNKNTETLSSDLFSRISEEQSKILDIIDKHCPKTAKSKQEDLNVDPNNFRKLNIFPSREDLLGNSKLLLQPNIVDGAYTSVEHYLDLQFKLLREDCFGPVRDGLCKYQEDPLKTRYENIRVFPHVRILRTYVSNNKAGYIIDIAYTMRRNQKSVDSQKYAQNKNFMFGSLLLFTNDKFETVLCATVLDSSMNLLRDGYIAVSFQNPVSKTIFEDLYIMVESDVFFEPYHRVLKVLQTFKHSDMPMRKYIVEVKPDTGAPAYLSSETIYSIVKPGNSQETCFPALDIEQWPPKEFFELNQSQMDAYKFALTREFAVIQGPPGTGKTFLGIKIATTLLRNLSLEGTPMLIICFTNHALDQFLEGILNFTQSVVRLGRQSKSKALAPYTLYNLKGKFKSKYSYLYGTKRAELEKIFKEMTDLQTEIEKCEKEMLSYKTLKPCLKIDNKMFALEASHTDPVLSWLFGDEKNEPKVSDNKLENWENQLEELTILDKIESCFSEQWALKEIDSLMSSIKYVKDMDDDHLEGQKMIDKFEEQIKKVSRRLKCFKLNMSLCFCGKQEVDMKSITNLYQLTQEQRWKFYFRCVDAIKNELVIKMNTLLQRHNTASKELDDVATLTDVDLMQTVRVVGVTTTTAARRHDLMRLLHSSIVIVEEAAEVLEAHVVASLTHHCKHLILIGDHKQLRPSAAHYKLGKDYNLEISLFERMIRNGIHARTLSTQRRMRPTFVDLLVPVIYERLDSHPTVMSYPDVRGMADNLFFYTHNILEEDEGSEDGWSHKNTIEARWCVALADYLRQMKYESHEVTILSTYNGQVGMIKELSKKYPSLEEIKITTVDNFQGEESRIVILSLVRSNKEGKIGFLSETNRICVALSRAKEGFYIFGNMECLKSANNIWRFINDKLVTKNAIGSKLVLRCDRHDNILHMQNPEDFETALAPIDTCLEICQVK